MQRDVEAVYCVLETIGELSPRQREVVWWICKGYKQREVAEKMGITQQAVSKHLRIARNRMRGGL